MSDFSGEDEIRENKTVGDTFGEEGDAEAACYCEAVHLENSECSNDLLHDNNIL